MQDLSSLDQGSNPRLLQWKRGVLTTGPPGESHKYSFKLQILEIIFSNKRKLTKEEEILWK